jgi:serine O-acetyltransferase
LNAVDLYYEVVLPRIFYLDHPVGTVLGRAVYGDYFSFTQNCSVGHNKGVYPVIGENVRMMPGSMILGRSRIGDNVIVSANTYIKDTDIPSCSVVFGSSPNLIIKSKDRDYFID